MPNQNISHKQYSQIVESAQEGICILDLNRNIVFSNKQLADLLSTTVEKLNGADLFDYTDERCKDLLDHLLDLDVETKGVRDDVLLIDEDGKEVWTVLSIAPSLNEEGVSIGTLILVSNISDKKITEERQRQTHERLALHLENSPMGFMELDNSMQIIKWSSKAEEIYGWTEIEAIGKDFDELNLIFEEDRETCEQVIRGLRVGGVQTSVLSLRAYRKTGEILYSEWYSSAVQDSWGDLTSILIQMWDVTEQVQAQKALRESEERFELAVRGAGLGVWDWNVVDDELIFNKRSEKMMRLNSKIPVGSKEWVDAIHPDDKSSFEKILTKHLIGDTSYFESEYRVPGSGNQWLWVLDRARIAERASDGRILRVTGTQMDITERKEVEHNLEIAKEASEMANKTKSTFLAHMSHDIRTPLNSILGFAELLSQESMNDESIEIVNLIKKSGQRLLYTMNSVLDLAQLEGKDVKMKIMRLDLGALVDEVVDMHLELIQNKGLAVTVEILNEGSVYAEADEAALYRVLCNLLTHRIHATETGTINLSVYYHEGLSCLKIQDTSEGFEDNQIPDVFEAFTAEVASTSTSNEGADLSLAISKMLIDLMGAKVSVSSVPGKSATFSLVFGAEGSNELSTGDKAVGTYHVFTEDMIVEEEGDKEITPNLLVVDDDVITRKMFDRFLGGDYDLTVVSGFDDALRAARKKSYNAMILDINLGESRTGNDLLGMLRDIPQHENTLIIACTAQALPGDKEKLIESGFDAYLSKPFSYKRLRDIVEQVVSKSII